MTFCNVTGDERVSTVHTVLNAENGWELLC